MKLVLVDDEGVAHDLVEDAEGYNLDNPIASTFFVGTMFDSLKRIRDAGGPDLFVVRESDGTIVEDSSFRFDDAMRLRGLDAGTVRERLREAEVDHRADELAGRT